MLARRNIFNDFFSNPLDFGPLGGNRPLKNGAYMMKTDIKEIDGTYELAIDLPGFKKDNVEVSLNDGYLVIRARTEQMSEETKSGSYLRKERFEGSCSRSFYIGDDVSDEDIKAKFKDGILKICIPKKTMPETNERHSTIAIEGE